MIQLNTEEIKQILPHRPPMLLVDRIIDLVPFESGVGIKNVTLNEPFFPGHFPGNPIMPGVFILEAMAQVGGIAMLYPEENRGQGRKDNLAGEGMLLLGNFLRVAHRTVIEVAAAEFRPVGIEDLCQFTVKGQADPVIQIGLGRKVHRAGNGAAFIVEAHHRRHAAVPVVHVQPLETVPAVVNPVQGGFTAVQVVQRLYIFLRVSGEFR